MYGADMRYLQCLGGEACGKEPLGRPRRRWKDNITMDLQEWWGGGAWNGLIRLKTGIDGELL
jgi:hypothetical protein